MRYATVKDNSETAEITVYNTEYDTHSSSVINLRETVIQCKTLIDAHTKLIVAGWKQNGAIWEEPYRYRNTFVGVPILGQYYEHTYDKYVESLKFKVNGKKLQLGLRVSGLSADKYAFSFCLEEENEGRLTVYDLDPVLGLCSHSLVKIEAVGCWYSQKEAVEMAEFFVRRMEEHYGRELFKEALHAYILRGIDRAPSWVLGVDIGSPQA